MGLEYKNSSSRLTIHILWGIGVAAFCAFTAYFPITNTDIWWHLASGRKILESNSFLYFDSFTFTPSEKWIDLHWLFQVLVYGIQSNFGFAGLLTFKLMAAGLSGVLLAFAIPSQHKRFIVVAMVLSYVFIELRYLILLRPILITIICIGAYLYCLERYIQRKRLIYLLILIPLQILWTNSQGLFILGPVITGIYLLGSVVPLIPAIKKWHINRNADWCSYELAQFTLLFIVLIQVSIINPYGLNGLLFPLKLFTRIDPSLKNIYAFNVSENLPLLHLRGADLHYLLFVLLSALSSVLIFIATYKKIHLEHIFLFGAMLALAVMAKRNVLLYGVVMAPISAHYLQILLESEQFQNYYLKMKITIKIAAAIALAIPLGIRALNITLEIKSYPQNDPVSPFRVPIMATDEIRTISKKHNPLRFFNSIRYGGYLNWVLPEKNAVFIDGRLIIRSTEFLQEYFNTIDFPKQYFPGLYKKFGFTHIILPTAVFTRYFKFAAYLYNHTDWHVRYYDGETVIFAHRAVSGAETDSVVLSDTETLNSIFSQIKERWPLRPSLISENIHYVYSFLLELDTNIAQSFAEIVKRGGL